MSKVSLFIQEVNPEEILDFLTRPTQVLESFELTELIRTSLDIECLDPEKLASIHFFLGQLSTYFRGRCQIYLLDAIKDSNNSKGNAK